MLEFVLWEPFAVYSLFEKCYTLKAYTAFITKIAVIGRRYHNIFKYREQIYMVSINHSIFVIIISVKTGKDHTMKHTFLTCWN